MKKISPNIWILLLRICLLSLFIYMFQWPLAKFNTGQYLNNPISFWLGLILISMFPIYLVWTLFGVLWVTISADSSIIRFHYLYKTIQTASLDIDSYYKTTHKTKVSNYKGLLIKLKSDKVIEITEYNLKSIRGVEDFLRINKVPLRGEKSSWFPLKRGV